MLKKIIICVVILAFVFASVTLATTTKEINTVGTETWAQGIGEAWNDCGLNIFLEIRLYDNSLTKLDEFSGTNLDYVYVQTGIHYGYNYNTCVTFGSYLTY